MSAAIGDWPFCAASGGVVRECGDIVDGCEAKLGGGTGGIFRSGGGGSHCWPSPLSFTAVPSSGSGEAFLFMLMGCFPLSVGQRGLMRACDRYAYYKY